MSYEESCESRSFFVILFANQATVVMSDALFPNYAIVFVMSSLHYPNHILIAKATKSFLGRLFKA